jgi:tryptophanyl-tRNA synthetase
VKDWVWQGCTTAGIGCLECKQRVIDAVLAELAPIRERAQEFAGNRNLVRSLVAEGCEAARDVARETLAEVRDVMGLKSAY